jgi:hypothetical protein
LPSILLCFSLKLAESKFVTKKSSASTTHCISLNTCSNAIGPKPLVRPKSSVHNCSIPSAYKSRLVNVSFLYAYGSHAHRPCAPGSQHGGAIYPSLHRVITPDCHLLCAHMLMSSYSCPDVSIIVSQLFFT